MAPHLVRAWGADKKKLQLRAFHRIHTHTHTHTHARTHARTHAHTLQIHAPLGWVDRKEWKETTKQYAEEKRRVFSDLHAHFDTLIIDLSD